MSDNTKMNHFELMKLPWNMFLGYFFAIKKKYKTKQNTNYFKSQKLTNIWEKNKHKWQRKKVS